MNKERRETISKAIERMEEAKSTLETAMEEEQEFFDNMPESFQQGDKGETAQSAIDNLQSAIDSLDSAIGDAESATG